MKRNSNKINWVAYWPTVIGVVTSYLVLFSAYRKEDNMTVPEWVAIAVALIGVVGTLIVTFLQLKRDGKTIDSIGTTTAGIDKETAIINTEVHSIADNVSTILPSVAAIAERSDKIDFVAKEIEYQKRVKREFSENAGSRDLLLAGIAAVYEENARLAQQHREDQEKAMKLIAEIGKLSNEVTQLENELKEMRSRHQQSNHSPSWGPEM